MSWRVKFARWLVKNRVNDELLLATTLMGKAMIKLNSVRVEWITENGNQFAASFKNAGGRPAEPPPIKIECAICTCQFDFQPSGCLSRPSCPSCGSTDIHLV